MDTVFTKIIAGDLPGRFVWADELAVGFLSINPLGPGHTLIVPRVEVDQWVDAEPDLLTHVMTIAHAVGGVVKQIWEPPRVGLVVAGFEVPHLHVHVFPAWDMGAFDFANAAQSVEPGLLDADMEAIRARLRDTGHGDHVPI